MDGPAGNTKGGEWPLEPALSERRSPTCAAAPEGQSRPNSELPLRPPLDPPVSARARDRIQVSPPENSRPLPYARCLSFQAPRAAQSPRPTWPGPRQQRPKAGLPPLPSLRPSTTCLGLGDPASPLAQHVPPRSARDAGALGLFPLPPGPLSDHVTLLQSPCPNFRTPTERCAVQPFRRELEPGHCLGTGWLEPATWPLSSCVPSRSAPDAAHSRAPRSPALPDSQ